MPGKQLTWGYACEVVNAQLRQRDSSLHGDGNVVWRSPMSGEEPANQSSTHKHKVPEPCLPPIVAEELDFPWNKRRTKMAQVAREPKQLIVDDQQRWNEET
jgi:hypothetical protein